MLSPGARRQAHIKSWWGFYWALALTGKQVLKPSSDSISVSVRPGRVQFSTLLSAQMLTPIDKIQTYVIATKYKRTHDDDDKKFADPTWLDPECLQRQTGVRLRFSVISCTFITYLELHGQFAGS